MRKVILFLLVVLLVAAAALAQTSKSDLAASVARMARVGRCFSPTFSPDGQQVAFVSDLSGTPQVWMVRATGGFPQMVTSGDDPINSVRWSPTNPELLAYSLAPGGGMNAQIYTIRPDGTGAHRLTAGGKDNNNFYGWTHDGSRIRMGSNVARPDAVQPYLADPVAGRMDIVLEGPGINGLQDVSREGKTALISRLISRGNNDLYLLDLASRKETLLTPHTGPGEFGGEIAPDGHTIYLASNKDRDLEAFARIRLDASGKPGPIEVIAERPDAELDGFLLNEQGTLAALIWNVGGKSELGFVDLPSGRVTRGPELPAELIGGLTFSRDGKWLAMVLSGAAAPPDIWIMGLPSRALHRVTFSPHAGVSLAELVRPELVKFKAQDGLELSGWLYRPKNQNGPGAYVVSYHGGPEGQERPAF